ncbi:recombinase family protein [Staphylococcus saprophyticus]|nr:recombinase family protein [Staphylococcus saprophyticus]
MIKKVAIYTRVSTLEQANEGYSIEGQEQRLKAYCKVHDWENYEFFVDAGQSASNTDRAGLQNMLNRLDEFDLILVYKLDRLTRSVRDLMGLLDTFEEKDVKFRSATEVFDTTSAIGKLFITLVGAMAEWERSTITERTTQGRRVATEKGIYTTVPPFYYDKIEGTLYPNDKKEIVEYIVKRAKDGVSIRGITEELNNSIYDPPKGKRWDKSLISYVLTAPVSRGHTHIGDVYVENTHEPVISEDDYNIYMKSISQRTHSRGIKHTAIFRGKLTCPNCDYYLSLNTSKRTKKDGTVEYDERYVCDRCRSDKEAENITIQSKEVERAFINHVKHGELDVDTRDNQEQEEQSIIDVDKVKRQRKKYQQAWAMDLMSDEEFQALIKETDDLLDQYNRQQLRKKERKHNHKQIEATQELILNAWSNMSEKDKEDLVNASISHIDYVFYRGHGYGKNRTPNTMKITHVAYKF